MRHHMLAVLALALLLPTIGAQTAWQGIGSCTLDAAIEYDLITGDVRLRADLSDTTGAIASSATMWAAPLATWPRLQFVVPFGAFYPYPPSNLHMELPIGGNYSAPPVLIAASAVTAQGLHVSSLYAFDLEIQRSSVTGGFDRVAWMRVGISGNQEGVYAQVYGDAGEQLRLVDPSGVVRATATLAGPGAPATFGLPNDHPDNPKWQVQQSIDGGNTWKILLGN